MAEIAIRRNATARLQAVYRELIGDDSPGATQRRDAAWKAYCAATQKLPPEWHPRVRYGRRWP